MKCLGCTKEVQSAMTINDFVDSIKIADLVAFFLHLETSHHKLKSIWICVECVSVLHKCYKIKMTAQTMKMDMATSIKCLNPNAMEFRPNWNHDMNRFVDNKVPDNFSCDSTMSLSPPDSTDEGEFSSSKLEASLSALLSNLGSYSNFRLNILDTSTSTTAHVIEDLIPTGRLFPKDIPKHDTIVTEQEKVKKKKRRLRGPTWVEMLATDYESGNEYFDEYSTEINDTNGNNDLESNNEIAYCIRFG